MKRFAALLDRLSLTPSRLTKLELIRHYLSATGDPERGWAMAALTGELSFKEAKPALIRTLVANRVDPVLFGWSYDFVGDLAEAVALLWPTSDDGVAADDHLSLTDIIAALEASSRAKIPALLETWLDRLDATGRWALLKLITGSLRVGVSARLARTALAEWAEQDLHDIEEVWHALTPPYAPLFDWLSGAAPRPDTISGTAFRPMMLSTPFEDADIAALDPQNYRAEWKWDGIRVQIVARGEERRLYSRTGDDIGRAFPELVEALNCNAVLDGELLVGQDNIAAPFNQLQQRLNRKQVSVKLIAELPAFVRLYDILFDGDEDLRGLDFDARRARLEAWIMANPNPRCDLSPLLPFDNWPVLAELQQGARANAIEGLMIKRRDSTYVGGRPKGPWFKWKRGALTIDCVMMYAQRGHGKRSSFYSDYTFGCWLEDRLVPVGKAYFGFTDAELVELDRWVRNHTKTRFGPVREVEPGLVLEIAFDSVHRSNRHKSGVAMRFPRVHRIRWDKPATEADRLEALERLVL